MKRSLLRVVLVILGVVATLVINGLANSLPLNGITTGEVSDSFDVFFVPAGYVFSIWGVIYLGLILYAIYQALPAQRDNPRLARIDYPFVLTCAANIIWLFMWHYGQFGWTLVFMLALLGLLIMIYLSLGIGRSEVSTAERWLVRIPFSIYLGWITVATIANVTDVLDWINWSGWGISEQVWAVIMLIIATGVGFLVLLTRRDVAYTLVLVWAFAGIAVKQAAAPLVAWTAWVLAALLALVVVVSVVRSLASSGQRSVEPGV